MIDVRAALSKELKRQWAVFYKRLAILMRWIWRLPADPVSDVSFQTVEVDFTMKAAKVKVVWVLSPSDDVVSQRVKVVDPDDGQIFFDEVVGREVSEVVLPTTVSEKQKLQAIIVVTDGVNESDPVIVDWTVPDLTKPSPVSDVAFVYEVVDEETTADTATDEANTGGEVQEE